MAAEKLRAMLRDLSNPIDVAVLDATVAAFYTGSREERAAAGQVLRDLQAHRHTYLQVMHIIKNTKSMHTKFIALQVLEDVIKYRWNTLYVGVQDGMKNYVSKVIVKLSSDEASFRSERLYVNKLNAILVQIVKNDWPAKCTSCIPDIIAAAKTRETICENCNAILKTRSIKVGNLSSGATEHDIQEFFSFSGEVESIDIQSGEHSAYVTFEEPQGAATAVLLSGASIANQSVTIELAPNYSPPAAPHTETQSSGVASVVHKAEDVVSSMLAKGLILGKDELGKTKAIDEKLGVTSTAIAGVATIDQKIGPSQKLSAGTSLVNEKIQAVDQNFQVSERTKSVYTSAEETGLKQVERLVKTGVMKNRYVLTGVSWAAGTFNRVAQADGEVSQKTKEKVEAEQPAQPSQSQPQQLEGFIHLYTRRTNTIHS